MRKPLRPTNKDLRRATASFSAPVLGWNTRDNLTGMDPRFARELENMVVDGGCIRVRKGFALAAACSDLPEMLAAYDYGTVKKLFTAAANKIWEVDFTSHTLIKRAEGFLSNR